MSKMAENSSRAKQQHYTTQETIKWRGPNLTPYWQKRKQLRSITPQNWFIWWNFQERLLDRRKSNMYIRWFGELGMLQLEGILEKFDQSMKTHLSMWQNANYVCTLLGHKTPACYKLDSNIVGCLHTSASLGSGLAPTHRDPRNASKSGIKNKTMNGCMAQSRLLSSKQIMEDNANTRR